MTYAYLIDPFLRRIAMVPCGKLADMQRHVRGYIELAWEWPSGDNLFVDEEGLMKSDRAFFALEGRATPVCGCAIVVGPEKDDDSGDLLNPSATLDAIRAQVRFLSEEQVSAWAKANSSEPAVTIQFEGEDEPIVIATMSDFLGHKPGQ